MVICTRSPQLRFSYPAALGSHLSSLTVASALLYFLFFSIYVHSFSAGDIVVFYVCQKLEVEVDKYISEMLVQKGRACEKKNMAESKSLGYYMAACVATSATSQVLPCPERNPALTDMSVL